MLILLYYCLKVIVCSGLLYGYYLLALRNNRFHQWNRYYLLAIIVISFTLPLLQIPLPFLEEDERPVVQSFRIIAAPDIYFSKLQPSAFVINWPLIAGVLYGCIVLVLVLLFVRNIRSVLNLKKHYREENLNGIYFYNTTEPATPFSFFNNIFWNSSISLNNEKGQQMLRHELTHVQENHSVDKVAMELLIAVAWWNPFLFYIRKELSVIHEFIADKKASSGNDCLQYASLLLMKALGSQQYALGNPFFHSQLKRRLTMLTTINNPKFSYLRRLLVLPLAVLAVVLFSFKYEEGKKSANKQQETTMDSPATVRALDDGDDFEEDTTLKKHAVIKLKKDYKGSAILNIVPTFDLKGVVVKTVDGKTYFLNREESAKELGMTFSEKSWTAPPGAYVIYYDENGVPGDDYFNDNLAGTKSLYSPLRGRSTINYNDSANKPSYITNNKEVEEALKALVSGIESGNVQYGEKGRNSVVQITTKEPAWPENPLYIIDGREATKEYAEKLMKDGVESIAVSKGDGAIRKFGDKGKNGVIEISTKELLPEDALYIVDGKKVSIKEAETLFFSRKDNINWYVEVIDGAQALPTYGEAGKNGVVIINTKLAKNELTMSEAGPDNSLTEKVVIGHKIGKDNSAFREAGMDNLLVEKVGTGYRIRRESSAVKSQASPTIAKQPNDLGEVVVVGYGQKKSDAVFTKAEEPASFPGGIDGWRRYLERNLKYPEAAQEKGTQGTVRVQLTVHEDGNLTDIKALNDPGNGLAEEAERVIKKGPKWIPAKHNGKIVTYRLVQTLTFQLQ